MVKKQIVLEFGSGNTCKNNKEYVQKMLDALRAVDNDNFDIVIKWQLFEKTAGDPRNIPLKKSVFDYAYRYAKDLGYKTTSSVFDVASLDFLLEHDIPFVKISCNSTYDFLMDSVPKNMWIYKSISMGLGCKADGLKRLYLNCIPSYPASTKAYMDMLQTTNKYLKYYISDHTDNWKVFKWFRPDVYECHFKLKDSTGLDAGVFARTPEQLGAIL